MLIPKLFFAWSGRPGRRGYLVMKLLVDKIGTTPTALRFEMGRDRWADRSRGDAADWTMVEGPIFELRAHAEGRNLHLAGQVACEVEATCSRCLKRYRQPLRDDFGLILEPAAGVEMPDPESEQALAEDGLCLGDELDAGWYRGGELRLSRFFDEVVALSLPVVALCREDCPGLCPVCGGDREITPCDCQEIKPESPFAALAVLRDSSGNGEN